MKRLSSWAAPRFAETLLVVFLTLGGWNALRAATYTWTQTATGNQDWNIAANWGGVGFPNAAGDEALMNAVNVAATQTIRLQQPITIGRLDLGDVDGTNQMNLASGTGTNVLTFQAATAGGDAFLNTGTGTISNSISAGVNLGGTSSLVWTSGGQGITTTGVFAMGSNNVTLSGGTANGATWSLTGDLTGSGTITYNGVGGIFVNSSVKSFTGTIVANRGRGGSSNAGTVTTTTGSLANASAVILNGSITDGVTVNGGSWNAGNNSAASSNPGQRFTQNTITLNGGSIVNNGQRSDGTWSTVVVDNVNTININSGFNLYTMGVGGSSGGTQMNVANLARGAGGSLYARSDTFGTTAQLIFGNASDYLIGGTGGDGSTNMKIIPWIAASSVGSITTPSGFATHTATGIRALNTSTEYATSITAGADQNVSVSSLALASDATVNSLRLTVSSSQNIGAGRSLTIASGGVFFTNAGGGIGVTGDASAGTLNFGGAEGVVWSVGTNTNRIGAALTGAGGLTKAGTGTLILTGDNAGLSGLAAVSGGILQIGEGGVASSLGVSDVTVANGAILRLTNADALADDSILTLQTYGLFQGTVDITGSFTEVIGGLYFGDDLQIAGVYGAIGSGAQFETSFITGTGFLQVVPEPSSAGLLMGAWGGLFWRVRRRRGGGA